MNFKFIKLNNGKTVPCIFESEQTKVADIPDNEFDFKKLNDGTIVKIVKFVDINGDVVKFM